MEWLKHSTGSHDDPDISDAMDEFGHSGYAVFFIILEIYGQEFNHADNEGWITFSVRFLERKLRLPWSKRGKTLEQAWNERGADRGKSRSYIGVILGFFANKGRIEIRTNSRETPDKLQTHSKLTPNLRQNTPDVLQTTPEMVSIRIPKYIEISSNWIKRKHSSPTEALQRSYRVPTAKEVEEKKKLLKDNVSKDTSSTLPADEDEFEPEDDHDEGIKKTDKIPPCPHQEIIKLYRKHLPMCSDIVSWNGTRQKNLGARWRENKERQCVEWWDDFFQKVSLSKFLTGRVTGKNGRPFFANLDWIVLPSNFTKILEGRYHE